MIWLTHICKVNIILKEYKKELKSTKKNSKVLLIML
nr:MAG TPA: hypothetical protein [Caudoviricetes sp.]DAX61036.1 MAG TPA: hypothetical protein [Caudoviricetes sp.]